MSEWKPKRFWQDVSISKVGKGYAVLLDGRRVNTPAKAPLILPTLKLAEAVAEEWRAQIDVVDPAAMPFTGAANAALDKVTHQFEEVAGLVSAYAETDLFCYRAEAPRELVERQQRAWDPMLDWSRDALNAPLNIAHGVMFIRQPPKSISTLRFRVNKFNPFELTALYDLVGLSGSLVAGLAVVDGHEAPESVWDICQVDETWQKEQWGQDEIAEELTLGKRTKFLQAFKFFATLR